MCVVLFPVLFLILIICVFFPFFFVSLARALSFLWSLQKTSLLVSLIFLYWFSIFNLIPALLYTLSFLVLAVQLLSRVQPALCNPMDCSPPGSSVHGILQERKLEWVAMPSSRGSSWPSSQSHMSWGSSIGRRILYHWARREACTYCYILTSLILKFM